jgi:DNA-binding NarL/FixJ family response regulator
MVMPGGMNGLELVASLRASVPDIPAVYISGYPARLNLEELAAGGRDSYVAKPFSATELAAAVRRTLDRRDPDSQRPTANLQARPAANGQLTNAQRKAANARRGEGGSS